MNDRLAAAYTAARDALLAARNAHGYWTGELSTSALSTATAVLALELVGRNACARQQGKVHAPLIAGGLAWLAAHQNDDGGWGDTVKSLSNVSTTMLAHAAFHATGAAQRYAAVVSRAAGYIEAAGGVKAVLRRYGQDRTFSIPILTHCALAGLVDWTDVLPLPFELACLPPRFYKILRLPVVSYALPALIAIGQVRHHFVKPANPLVRLVRQWARTPSLKVLERIQPSSGGFLEATPLTSFVTMSLAGMGLAEHPVARRGVEFLVKAVRPDGSWPIDTNLAIWVTTLAVNALGDDLPEHARQPILQWLLEQQYRLVHPYTNAAPGGWAWTDLPGGVPDGDDTPGAILALLQLLDSRASRLESNGDSSVRAPQAPRIREAVDRGVDWLLALQNRDGGWPTFCRGWGTLPFDRSSADITAHVIRALEAWSRLGRDRHAPADPRCRAARIAAERGFDYLRRVQQPDGSWLPLWFGNQHAPDEGNPTYGTSRVLAAFRASRRLGERPAVRGLEWLCRHQNDDGGWGGIRGTPSSVEETALAAEMLLCADPHAVASLQGLQWLIQAVETGRLNESSPIGFYFARLWYFESLYPLIFTVSALRRAVEQINGSAPLEQTVSTPVCARAER